MPQRLELELTRTGVEPAQDAFVERLQARSRPAITTHASRAAERGGSDGCLRRRRVR
jgi:hypothetical protein